MSGQLFICYRRNDSRGYTGRIHDHLAAHFSSSQIFMDVANIEPGMDFVTAIETAIGSCDVLLAIIGEQWLTASAKNGGRLIDYPEDYVRAEIVAALKRDIRVIPVLLDNAKMPEPADLPDELKPLARRNAFSVHHASFRADMDRLVDTLSKIIEPLPPVETTGGPSTVTAPSVAVPSKEELLLEIVACFKKLLPGEVTMTNRTTIRFPAPDKWYDILIYLNYALILIFLLSEALWIASAVFALVPLSRFIRVRYTILFDVEKGIFKKNLRKHDIKHLSKTGINHYRKTTSWFFVFTRNGFRKDVKMFRVNTSDNMEMQKLLSLLQQYYDLPDGIPVEQFRALIG